MNDKNEQNNEVLDRIDALMDRFYTPQTTKKSNEDFPTLTESITLKNSIVSNNDDKKNNEKFTEKNNQKEFLNFLNKRLYAEISGILKILIPNLTEKIYKEFLTKNNKK